MWKDGIDKAKRGKKGRVKKKKRNCATVGLISLDWPFFPLWMIDTVGLVCDTDG